MDEDSLCRIRWTRSPVPLVEAEDRTSHALFIVVDTRSVPGDRIYADSPNLNETNAGFGIVPDGVDLSDKVVPSPS